MFPPSQYPINLSGAQMSQAFYSSDYAPCYESPSIPKSIPRNKRHTAGSAADIPRTPSNGQGDDNEEEEQEEEEDDVEEEEIRGRRLPWTEQDNMRLVCNF